MLCVRPSPRVFSLRSYFSPFSVTFSQSSSRASSQLLDRIGKVDRVARLVALRLEQHLQQLALRIAMFAVTPEKT